MCKIILVHIKGALFGVMNEPFKSIKMHRIISKYLEKVISYDNRPLCTLTWFLCYTFA